MRTALACALLTIAFAYWRIASPHAATSNTVLFDREIVRILNDHCVMCHAEGGPSFPLSTYEQTWLARAAIHREVLAHRMPPWAAVQGYGKFANANTLTLRETRFIVSWVEGLGPRNSGTVFLNVLDRRRARRDRSSNRLRGVAARRAGLDGRAAGRGDARAADDGIAACACSASWSISSSTRSARCARSNTAPSTAAHCMRPCSRSSKRVNGSRRGLRGTDIASCRKTSLFGYRPGRESSLTSTPRRTGRQLSSPECSDSISDQRPRAASRPTSCSKHPRSRRPARNASACTPKSSSRTTWRRWRSGRSSPPARSRSRSRFFTPTVGSEVLLFALHIPLEWPTPAILATPAALPAGSRLSVTAYTSNPSAVPAEQRLRVTVSTVE